MRKQIVHTDRVPPADVLVHEMMHLGGVESLLKRVPNAATLRVNLLRHHTSTEDVGRVAAAAGVQVILGQDLLEI